jgi:hypothetical protein
MRVPPSPDANNLHTGRDGFLDMLVRLYPDIQATALERFLGGPNLYDSRTHKPRAGRSEEEAFAILWVASCYARDCQSRLTMSEDERRCWERRVSPQA